MSSVNCEIHDKMYQNTVGNINQFKCYGNTPLDWHRRFSLFDLFTDSPRWYFNVGQLISNWCESNTFMIHFDPHNWIKYVNHTHVNGLYRNFDDVLLNIRPLMSF